MVAYLKNIQIIVTLTTFKKGGAKTTQIKPPFISEAAKGGAKPTQIKSIFVTTFFFVYLKCGFDPTFFTSKCSGYIYIYIYIYI
jgi:hypothetical protein